MEGVLTRRRGILPTKFFAVYLVKYGSIVEEMGIVVLIVGESGVEWGAAVESVDFSP